MSAPHRKLLSELAQRLGMEALLDEDEDLLLLDFELGPRISLVLEGQDALIVSARLGTLPQGDPELAEELLAANLMLRATEGAALALDRYTRQVFLTRRWRVAELADVQGLEAALQDFVQLGQLWQQALEQLVSAPAEASPALPIPPGRLA